MDCCCFFKAKNFWIAQFYCCLCVFHVFVSLGYSLERIGFFLNITFTSSKFKLITNVSYGFFFLKKNSKHFFIWFHWFFHSLFITHNILMDFLFKISSFFPANIERKKKKLKFKSCCLKKNIFHQKWINPCTLHSISEIIIIIHTTWFESAEFPESRISRIHFITFFFCWLG